MVGDARGSHSVARDFGMDAGKRKGGGGKGEIGKERQQVEVGDGT